jgi:ABC-2 type transport system ATP-binding protein
VGLVGANGAGKTTLIKALLDLCDIERGSIDVFGVSHLKPEARERIGFLPEKFLLPYFATGKEYLRFMARLHGRPVDTPAIREVLAMLDLEERACQNPSALCQRAWPRSSGSRPYYSATRTSSSSMSR